MSIPAVCDICSRSFWAEPDSVVDLYVVEDWETKPDREPDGHVLVCQDCEHKFVFDE